MLDDASEIERGSRLRSLRGLIGLSRLQLCEKAASFDESLNTSTLRHWEEGRGSGLTDKGAKKMVRIYAQLGVQCDISWLLFGFGTPPIVKSFKNSALKSSNLNHEYKAAHDIQREIALFLQSHTLAFTVTVVDDAMYPAYRIGDILGAYARETDEIDKFINEDCIIETEDGLLLCRRLLKGRMPGHYILNCTNPNTTVNPIYDVKLIRAAPVIWMRRRDKDYPC